MNADELAINLRLLASVGKNQKIVTRDAYLNIEAPSLVPEGLRRWIRNDNRNETLRHITSIVDQAIHLNTQFKDHQVTNVKYNFDKYLKNSIKGLRNLQETYSACIQTCARLQVILDRIFNHLGILDDMVTHVSDDEDS